MNKENKNLAGKNMNINFKGVSRMCRSEGVGGLKQFREKNKSIK